MNTQSTFPRFAKRNQAHHIGVANRLNNRRKLSAALVNREKYFQQLAQIPLFERLLAKRKTLILTIRGENQAYQVCGIGVKDINFILKTDKKSKRGVFPSDEELDSMMEARITFVIDPLKRMRYFFKPTEEYAKNASWVEIRPITRIFDDGIPMVYSKVRKKNEWDKAEAIQLSTHLQSLEKGIDFANGKEKILIKHLLEIQELM